MIIRSTSHRPQPPSDGGWKSVLRVLPSLARFAALCFCLIAAVCTARGEAMLQLFQVKWADVTKKMPEIAEAGYTSIYLPQPAKAGSVFSVGYDLFDPFDLGDKDQRFTVATKYGTKAELLEAVATAHRFGIRVYFDNIMNHRGFDVPGYNAFTPTNIYPGLIPADFHLQTIPGGFNRNWPTIEDYSDQWKVQNEPLSGLLDLANEPGNLNFNFGNTLGSTTTKPTFIRQPNSPEYYADPALPDLGGGWRPFNATNGVPVPELVEAYLIRAAMWTLYETKCDGFRLDAVKHTPANFFGNGGNAFAGYTGGIQAMYDWVHGYGTNFNSDYLEADDCRNSCFNSEAPRNDALLFGEHLGFPPGYGDYISAGMRLLNTSMRGAVDHWAGGGAGWGLDQRDIGDFAANQGVQFAQNHDHMFCCVNARHLHNAYNFMHEGIPIIYSDGNNFAGDPYQSTTFPVVPFANYLGQYGDNQMPDVAWLHHQLARGGTRSRWSDANIVAWERYDYREVSGGDAFTNAHATVVLFAANNKTSFPGDINFDDGINQSPDGYYHCGVNDNPSRGVAMRVGFPPGSILSQLASSTPGNDRTCRKLLVHRATTDAGAAATTANAPDPVDRLLLVNAAPPPGGGAIEMKIPSGGWVMYGYQWPEASRANIHSTAITLQQAGIQAPTITVYRKDGTNGDPGFNPLYPFKMRGSVDAGGNIIGGVNVSNLTYAVDIPVVTNGNFDILVRSDASAINTLIKLDGGVDLNSHLGLGVTSGLDRRDNRPGSATDVFLGYEQSLFLFRNGPEKFAARDVARNTVVSHGAETYWYTVGGTNWVVNGSTNGLNTTTA
ncbi:MAG TPA: alpha-amylase family glycosyl hydrolase, partial [Verrucomicrobiota bacterium]|nr:alpha-amylase family glycosyl hydrolase [Verrucomicrobiota bacterium]